MSTHRAQQDQPKNSKINLNKEALFTPMIEVVSQKQLINTLNYAHFKRLPIRIEIPEKKKKIIEVAPSPVLTDYPVFLFKNPRPYPIGNNTKKIQIVIPFINGTINFTAPIKHITKKGICIRLPRKGNRLLGPPRHSLSFEEIGIRFMIHGNNVKGTLLNFHPDHILIKLSPLSSAYAQKAGLHRNYQLSFLRDKSHLFNIDAKLIANQKNGSKNIMHFKCETSPKKSKEVISPFTKSYQMTPAPDLEFIHPLNGSKEIISIEKLSAQDLLVSFQGEALPLLPGMHIPQAAICLSDLYSLPLSLNTVEAISQEINNGEKTVKCRLTIDTISEENHRRLQTLVHKSETSELRLSAPIENDDLWRFMFDTGFIYKKKYQHFLGHEQKIKRTYKKIYSGPTQMMRHFSFRENGRTMGHVSMMRLAEKAWMVHHLAALKGASLKVGLSTVDHINHYIYDSIWHPTHGMKYLVLYFRPENSFPNFIFGGFKDHAKNPKICSSDLFGYSLIPVNHCSPLPLPQGWTLSKSTIKDIETLEQFYMSYSGGLMLDAFDFVERESKAENLTKKYHEEGIIKKRILWTLHHNKKPCAIFIVNISDTCLNMSDLTNGIKSIIMAPEIVTKKVLLHALEHLTHYFDTRSISTMIYPFEWINKSGFTPQKQYNLWIFNTAHADIYMEYCSTLIDMATGKK